MDKITISADWWCPQDRLQKTKKQLAEEICSIAASHVVFDVKDDGTGKGYIVRAELKICVGDDDGENES